MAVKQVVVKDCPRKSINLYKISDYDGVFYVYQIDPGFISDTHNAVGTSRSCRDALELVKAYSGGNNLQISDW